MRTLAKTIDLVAAFDASLNPYMLLDAQLRYAGMNQAYRTFFGTAENPELVARTTVQVAALGAPHFLVEIEATAAKARGR